MFDADEIIYEAAKEALPACTLSRRREILQALRVKLIPDHPAHKNVETQLAMLDALDRLQSELSFERINAICKKESKL